MSKPFLTFGDWMIRPAERCIERHGQRFVLEPRLMDVLMQLAGSAGSVVSTEELLATCWPGEALGDNPVHKCVAMLRRAFGDDARAPTYIETIRKRGYRVIARVAFADGRHQPNADAGPWQGGSPYPGNRPFSMTDAPLFFGRRRQRRELLDVVSQAFGKGAAFVLVCGNAGVGTTSMVQAGIAPSLLSDAGYGAIRARGCVIVDASASHRSCIDALASAMCRWEIGGTPVFAISEHGMLTRALHGDVEAVLGRIRARLRASGGVLLLVVDALDRTLMAGSVFAGDNEQGRFVAALIRMAASGCIGVIATCRTAGRADLMMCVNDIAGAEMVTTYRLERPGPGELANMIRQPALLAGLTFEEDALSERRLDDVLLEEASAPWTMLSSLQRVLHSLYVARTPEGMLTFAGYSKSGGLHTYARRG